MTPARLREIREAFEQALQLPHAPRNEFLSELLARDAELHAAVRRLLDAHANVTAATGSPTASAADDGSQGSGDGGERRIGSYEIVRRLGRGGMGDVYLAYRADRAFTKPLAIKIVRPALANRDVIDRFRQEREILAALDHPHIARLLDAGSTPEGFPYFVMEYVDGQPIDQFCDEHKLTVRARLDLFRQVCGAVEYAHQKRIVHRDIKPSNVLVSADGTAKLLDFGIAKLVGATTDQTAYITRAGQQAMTPEYASPEQIKGERITPATDVYALGVVLYELLSGRRPYRLTSRIFHEIARIICEEEPTKPSTAIAESGSESTIASRHEGEHPITPAQISHLRQEAPSDLKRLLSGDLDHIVLKALRKEPQQRYASAGALQNDIERHLAAQPVLAKGPGTLESGRKLVRRHPAALGALVVLLVLTATGSVTFNASALLFLIGFSGSLAFGYVIRRIEWGRRMAETDLPAHAVFLLVCLLTVTILFRSLPHRQYEQAMVVLNLSLALSLTVFLLGFALRPQRGGRVLLDLSRPMLKTKVATAGVMLPALGVQVVLRWEAGQPATWPFATYVGAMLLYTVYQLLFLGQLQLRERGVKHHGVLVPWRRILSYRWDPDRGEFAVVRVRVKRLIDILPADRWMVPIARKAELEAVLAKQFSEWSTE